MFRWLRRSSKQSKVKKDEALERIAHEWRELEALGTAISLDRDGVTDEQVRHYHERREEIKEQFGSRLWDYMKARGI